MDARRLLLAMLLVFGGIALLGGGCIYGGYNRAITLDENVHKAWAQVDSKLQRRYDLIPNLVETVKGVTAQEQDVFLGIAEARKSYFQAQRPAQKARAAGVLEGALSRLLVLRETYPELRSNESFLKLQDTLEGSENRISVERDRYNEAVQALNTFVRRFPGAFYASLAGVEKAEYFEVSDEARAVPKVDFSEKSDG